MTSRLCVTRGVSRQLLMISALFFTAAFASGASDKSAKKDPRGLEVLVASDAAQSEEGFRPKPGKPVYYLFSQSRQTLGDAVAGVKLPEPEVVEKYVTAELSKQGFVRAEVGSPIPSILILAIVGDSNFEEPRINLDDPLNDGEIASFMYQVNYRAFLEKNMLSSRVTVPMETLFDPERRATPDEQDAKELFLNEAMRLRFRASPRAQDKKKIMTLVGADKIEKGMADKTLSSSDAEAMAWSVYENRYFVTLNAFDAARWKNKERVLLWRTTMIIDWRKDLATELPAMLAKAGPVFGTDVAVPTLLDNRDSRKSEVEVGPFKVVPPETPAAKK